MVLAVALSVNVRLVIHVTMSLESAAVHRATPAEPAKRVRTPRFHFSGIRPYCLYAGR